jgi:hypothetical protein
MELIETLLATQTVEELAENSLPAVARMARSRAAFLWVTGPKVPIRRFFLHGFEPQAASEIERLCAGQLGAVSRDSSSELISAPASPACGAGASIVLCPLRAKGEPIAVIGLAPPEDMTPMLSDKLSRLFRVFAGVLDGLLNRAESQRQLSHLNTYLAVSSMLAQSVDLHELLQAALYCCADAVSAEAASVLLLDDEKKNFRFYQVEGPASPVLAGAAFPADKGLAGSVLETQQSEIINDVQSDPRFYGRLDSESGFRTRNMIAVPLTAGGERIGVLEVLNKAGGGPFLKEERLLLVSIAEEIAFAIRNAKLFEYVVNTYCKQRQGQMSCKGCKRPLGSWTPCVKYRQVSAG